MFEGSLYGHWEAICTFQAMIVFADEDGLIDMSPQALSGKTSLPLEIIRKGLKHLQQSDPHSRSPEHDGKRIVLLDEDREFGWRIVNYEYYRNLGRRADTKEKARERKRRQRERESQASDSKGCHAPVTPLSRKSAHTNTDTNTNTTKKKGQKAAPLTARFDDFWLAYPKKRKKKTAKDIWRRKKLDRLADHLIADVQARMASDEQWKEGYIPDPTTYLNQERWEDELKREDAKPTLDGQAAVYGITRQPDEDDESLKRRLGIAMTNARYAK